MSACGCVGPQNGDPVCPCRMKTYRSTTPGLGIPAPGGWPFIAQDLAKWAISGPLTADDVRRIVREELARDLGERPS